MNQIDQIKDILFSNEKRALDALTRRLEKHDSRVADIADVLPESIARSQAEGRRLGKALRGPVQESIKESIARDPQSFADALFPVMGPAIRKSISEALKSFSQNVNRAIEEKTSLKSIKWRLEARKAGVPYTQFLINRTLEYRVEHAYLIQPDTGLLIAHAHRPDAMRKDDAAISAMLTAIQGFVNDSFNSGTEGVLETADIGKYTLWVMQGPQAMLACVITGVPARDLRDQFMQVLEGIHLQYAGQLESFVGDNDKIGGQAQYIKAIEPQLQDCLFEQAREDAVLTRKKRGPGFVGVVLVLAVLALGWFTWQAFQFKQQAQTLIKTLEAEPGIFLTHSESGWGKIHLKGLRDNMAANPQSIAQEQGLEPERLELDFTPFHSLEKPIQLRRVQQRLSIPSGVSLQLSDTGELSFSGEISADFKRQALEKLQGMLGIAGLDFSAASYSDPLLLESARKILQPPAAVELSVRNAVLSVRGEAPYAWQKVLASKHQDIEGLKGLRSADLRVAELAGIRAIESELNSEFLQFVRRTRLNADSESKIEVLGERLKLYGRLLEALDIEPEIILTGFTDNSGDAKLNRDLQTERTLYIKGRLVGQGVRSNWIFVRSDRPQAVADTNPHERKVVITLAADLSAFD